MEKGRIIILNGVSSAGKTTLAKTLQNHLPQPYFHMDVDVFCLMSPEKFNIEDYSVQWRFVSEMFAAVKLFSDMGFHLVVPCIFLEGGDFLEKCVSLLHDYPVLFAFVTCSAEELRRREQARGDRKIGGAEEMLPQLCPKETYDITVDTGLFTMEECAEQIVQRIHKPEPLTAFKTLWSQR